MENLSFVDWAKRIKLVNRDRPPNEAVRETKPAQAVPKVADDKHKQEIQKFLSTKADNVFEDTLKLMETVHESTVRNPRIATVGVHFMILSELKNFVKNNPNLKAPLPLETQMRALCYAVSKKNRAWIETTFEAYKISTVPEDEVNKYVDKLVKDKCYADAAYIVVLRKLQTKRNLKDIAIPLLLEDKVNVLEYYIEGCPETAANFVSYLDSCKSCFSSDVVEKLAEGTAINPTKIKTDRFETKCFNKLIKRLMKKYNIAANCPVTARETKLGAVKFLLYKRFNEGSISEDCFREGLYKAVEECNEIIDDVIDLLISRRAIDEAIKFADFFKVPACKRPYELTASIFSSNTNSEPSSSWEPISWDNSENCVPVKESRNRYYNDYEDDYDDYDDIDPEDDVALRMAVFQSLTTRKSEPSQQNSQYLSLRIDMNDIHIVNTESDFDEAIKSIMCYNVIGIDCEWKPMFGALTVSNVQAVEIMQIATWDDCYLIDMMQLKDSVPLWRDVFEKIFCSPKILKIGFGIKSDWNNIKATVPKNVFSPAVNVLDFSDFSEWFLCKYPEIGGKEKEIPKDVKGLSKLTYTLLGKYINKDEQFSDWGRRPLREGQVKYAALDAYCLLQLYEDLYEKSERLGIDFEEISRLFASGKVSAKDIISVKLKANQSLNTTEDIKFEVTPIRHFKCLVDTMLQGLGRNLRICGADVKLIDVNDYEQNIVEYAHSKNAVILTSGHRYERFKSRVNPGQCFRIQNSISSYEQLKLIIDRFNLKITEKDLLSRCVKCNENHFEEMTSSFLRRVYERKVMKYKNVELKFEGLHISKFDYVDTFYLCNGCGQIYWEGCHHSRIKRKVQEVLFTDEEKEVHNSGDSPGKKITVAEEDVITID